jgi:2-polyprenyl-6-methoxyphenol hydroxylase-like FAD-dependent oxidoreductase
MRNENTEVLIVGAGPTGLLLACELARQAISFRIIDRAAKPSTLCRGLGIHSRSLEILEDLGLIDMVVSQGAWLPATSIYKDKALMKRVPLSEVPTSSEPFPSLLVLDQAKLEQILTEELARQGIEVERKCELKDFAQSKTGVSVTLSKQRILERLKCLYLVGCDGPRSRVRKTLGIDFVGFTYPRAYTLAEVSLDWELPAEMHRFLTDSVDLLATPLGGNRFRLSAWEDDKYQQNGQSEAGGSVHTTQTEAPTVERVQEILDCTAPGEPKVLEASALVRYKMELRLAASYGRGRCYIAGDACHVHPPTGSQGLNTGIQDAHNLGWKLASVLKGECFPELLESYEVERRPVGHWVLSNTHHAANSRFELAGRRFFVLGQKFLMARWNQLSVNYRTSSIVAQMDPVVDGRGIQAGDRAPDGVVHKPGKSESRRLFELFQGIHHHLLVFGGEKASDFKHALSSIDSHYDRCVKVHLIGTGSTGLPTESVWEDPDGEIAKAYMIEEPTLIFVRPDGYVGARVGRMMQQPFLHYLENCFRVRSVAT